ncbi:hypothetical protein JTB14_008094 [Gonioctena quinquepunctata]|nr:hypothetical protein JTB14_008094 [Gonioctena quinquepunctata]
MTAYSKFGLAMPCCIRMKRTFLQGLLWLYLFGFGFMALSLEPGFLDFDNLPDTNFTCVGKVIGGYYADLETNCQMFHVCTIGQLDEPMDIRFLCLNGTVFDQETRVCERIDEVDCTKSEQFYSLNLELYGNSQPSNLEENSETEQPLIIKSTLPTTTTTTTEPPRKTTHTPYYTTVTSPTTGGSAQQQLLSAHHFPVIDSNSPDIRFNPEEINISLHPGAPPDIRTISYYSDKKVAHSETKVVVTTHGSVVTTHRSAPYADGVNTRKSVNSYNQATPGDINFGFTYRNADVEDYHTDDPDSYHFHTEFRPSQEYSVPHHNAQPQQYTSSTYRNDYNPTTSKNNNFQGRSSTTIRNYFIESLKPPAADQQSQYGHHQSEKPQAQRLQLPLPTLPPLTFSSPAPFSLQQRVDTKRYTKDQFPPPRIVVSASASVSDASGRRLNYSLGTIGSAPLLKHPPTSYDDYKEEDVVLDPFYHDVQKLKHARSKRSLEDVNPSGRAKRSDETRLRHSDFIKNDEDAINVLRFLFDWYQNEKTNPARFTTPLSAPLNREGIASINDELSPTNEESVTESSEENDGIDFKFKTSDVFNKNGKYSIVGDDGVSINEVKKINNVHKEITIHHSDDPDHEDEIFQHEEDYVNDNYEPATYDNKYGNKEHSEVYDKDNDGKEDPSHLGYDFRKEKDANEKENLTDYEHEFRKDMQVEKSAQEGRHEHHGGHLTDYVHEREFNNEKIADQTYDNVHHSFNKDNEENKNYSLPNDYVDDNIEPIYYKERGLDTQESSEEQEQPRKITTPVEFFTESSDTSETYATSSKSSEPEYEQTSTAETVLSTSTTEPTISTEMLSSSTTLAHTQIETTVTTEVPTTTTRRARNNRRRGRRKYHGNTESHEKEIDFKKILIEKFIEKPYRAKDDYDYLRTVHVHSTTTTDTELDSDSESEKETTTANNPPTEQVEVTDNSLSIVAEIYNTSENMHSQNVTEPESSEAFSTTIPAIDTTSGSISKRRRGKQRNNIESNQKRYRERKTKTTTESSSDANNFSGIEGTSSTSTEDIISASNHSNDTFIAQQNVEKNETENDIHRQQHAPNKEPDDIRAIHHSEPLSEIIETTTKYVKTSRRGRGRTRFTAQFSNVEQQPTSSPAISRNFDTVATPSSPTTESLIESALNEQSSQATSTDANDYETSLSSERIEDIYATSFVPTTEATHITKKKELKDNFLNSDLLPTTESSLDMNTMRITDITEEFSGETTTDELTEPAEGMETTTGGYSDILTQVTTESDADIARTTTAFSKIDSNDVSEDAQNDSKGMSLLSIVVEERVEGTNDSLVETTTEIDLTSSVLPHNIEEIIKGYVSTDNYEISTDSSSEGPRKTTGAEEVHRNDYTVDLTEIEEETTEALIPTTEMFFETIPTSVSLAAETTTAEATTTADETTRVADEYSQIPTTLELTTLTPASPVVTTQQTSRHYHRRGGRPTRRRPAYQGLSYRHRFSSEFSTRRPEIRKQTIEDDSLSRRGKTLTTEGTVGTKDTKSEILTEYPLLKSVHPTQAERTLVTTPFSRKTTIRKHFFFNCFGREVDKFYPDMRDCRLFHYCTQGYSKNQLLDMKFVCDLNTFFDDEKLICTKIKPKRCL